MELGLLKFKDMVKYNNQLLGYKIWHSIAPKNIRNDFIQIRTAAHDTRSIEKLNFKKTLSQKKFLQSAPCLTIPQAWSEVDVELKMAPKLTSFKTKIKNNILKSDSPEVSI